MMPKLVLIEWEDSHHYSGWTRERPSRTAMTCQSVGWLLHDGKKVKTLTAGLSEGQQHDGEMTIPVAAIRSIKRLAVRHAG